MKARIKSFLARCALAHPIRGLVVNLVYPAIAKCLEGECQPDLASATGVVEALAWKTHAFQILSSELASGVNCCPDALASTLESREKIFEVIFRQLENVPGDIFEFGVSSGRSFHTFLKRCPDRHVYGFDSFEGLPEEWWTRPKGAFKAEPPKFTEPNGTLVQGWFEDTLPGFFSNYRQPIALIHVDCDIYSAAKYSLSHALPLCGVGSIVLFDEYYNYPNFAPHEWLAWHQEQTSLGLRSECVAYDGRRAAFRIISIRNARVQHANSERG